MRRDSFVMDGTYVFLLGIVVYCKQMFKYKYPWINKLIICVLPFAINPGTLTWHTHNNCSKQRHGSSMIGAHIWLFQYVGVIMGAIVNSPHKWPVRRKMFPVDDVILSFHVIPHKMNFYNSCITPGYFILIYLSRHWMVVTRQSLMTSSNGNIFHVTGPLCGEFTSPVNSPHTGQWRGALMFSLICS